MDFLNKAARAAQQLQSQATEAAEQLQSKATEAAQQLQSPSTLKKIALPPSPFGPEGGASSQTTADEDSSEVDMWRSKAMALEAKVNRAIEARKLWLEEEAELKQV